MFCGLFLIPAEKQELSLLRNRNIFHCPFLQKNLKKARKTVPQDGLLLLASGVIRLGLGGKVNFE